MAGPGLRADRIMPPLDDDFAGVLEDTAHVHAGIDLIRTGLRVLALERLTADQTQTVITTLVGDQGADVVTAVALLIQRLTNPDSNPALRDLDADVQKEVQRLGEQHAYQAADFAARDHEPVTEAAARIDGI